MSGPLNRRNATPQRRGRPLAMLALLVAGWVTMRTLLWEMPFPAPDDVGALLARSGEVNTPAARTGRVTDYPSALSPASHAGASTGAPVRRVKEAPLQASAAPLIWQDAAAPPLADRPSPPPPPPLAPSSPRTASAHQLLYLAAMSNLPVPQFFTQGAVTPAGPDAPEPQSEPRMRADRWSLDTWVFWRDGSNSALASAGRVPSYGASQAAGVLRYRLAPQSEHDPRAYFRAYRALIDRGEGELALGLSTRPFTTLPVRAHAEVRATRFDRNWEARPAVFATTELAPLTLTSKLRAETYLQGGYVGGDNATAFADGQIHLMRDLAEFDLGKLNLGAAAWGGAQEGAERLDVGPSLRLDLKVGQAPARLSLDWRERVAGGAVPNSGVALTLSTRF